MAVTVIRDVLDIYRSLGEIPLDDDHGYGHTGFMTNTLHPTPANMLSPGDVVRVFNDDNGRTEDHELTTVERSTVAVNATAATTSFQLDRTFEWFPDQMVMVVL